ncbi:MAG: lytic murein transglycosylase B [Candidatus Methylumidiphilus sp.]
MNTPACLFALGVALLGGSAPGHADIAGRPEVALFIKEVSARRHLDEAALLKVFAQVDIQPKIVQAMDRPAEAKPWWQYRKILLTEAQIQGGVEFWRRNRAYLDAAASQYGVAPEIIVAIIGAESRYGQNLGHYRVIDALSTLAFSYPRRADYFRKELEEYLSLCQEENINPLYLHGSYAGAMGMTQFMPSSFRQYAADLDGDSKRNIWTNPADAIASVANYFAYAGWHKGEIAAYPAKAVAEKLPGIISLTFPASHSVAELHSLGVEDASRLPEDTQAGLLPLATETGQEYWLTLHNFQVITHYNNSPLYAMAAFQLAQSILARQTAP